jgi:hypothetical protein
MTRTGLEQAVYRVWELQGMGTTATKVTQVNSLDSVTEIVYALRTAGCIWCGIRSLKYREFTYSK